MESKIQYLPEAYRRISRFAKTDFGKNIFGYVAQPIFTDLWKVEEKKLEEEESDELKDPLPLAKQISSAFVNNFSWGDLFSCLGVAGLAIQSKLFPSRNPKPGLIEKTFRTIALVFTFGGSLSAMFGRMLDMHRKVALGDKYADAKLKAAEKKGKKIFTEYNKNQIEELIQEAENLDKILIYKKGLKESILERYAKDDIGGLLDGPPGTGKTEGVKCILGKWARKTINEGDIPVIAELNLASFDEYLKETHQNTAEAMEAIQIAAGLGPGTKSSITSGEGLLILELLIKKIQSLINKVNRHNNENTENRQKLAIFVDEFDKIFDPRTLKGCDKVRLKNLLIQFNDLFVKTNILLTSNTSLEEMITEIKKHLRSEDGAEADEVWKPMYDRISSKNRARVDNPAAAEQAEIIAARLLKNFGDFIDWQDFGLDRKIIENSELSKKMFAIPIQEITTKLKLKLNGRQLSYACDDLTSMLLGKARELKAEKKIPDSNWDHLSPIDKIKTSGALIDKELLESSLALKAEGDRRETIAQSKAPEDKDTKVLNSIMNLAKQVIRQSKNPNKVNPEELLDSLHQAFKSAA